MSFFALPIALYIASSASAGLKCGDYAPQHMHVSESEKFVSPDCKWTVNIKSDPVGNNPAKGAIVGKNGKILYTFSVKRDAYLYWTSDNKFVVVDDLAGSDYNYVFVRKLFGKYKTYSIGEFVKKDVMAKIGVGSDIYHYYPKYYKDDERYFYIYVDVDYMTARNEGASDCLLYRIDKRTLGAIDLLKASADASNCGAQP